MKKGVTFRGGVHPPHHKHGTEHLKVEEAMLPKTVIIPMQQHIGAPCEPIVKAGDYVEVGQKIGEAKAFVSAPIHASVSGVVKLVQERQTATGKAMCIIIESDDKDTLHGSVQKKGDLDSLSPEELLHIVKEAGITGMGGASFPTHVKLSPPKDKKIDYVILNGAECEPYLTADHRLLLENPEKVVFGLRVCMKILGVATGYIAIETNKKDALEVLNQLTLGDESIQIVPLKTKYPQGDEKRIINAVTKRQVPSGGLPMDVGCVVTNVGTAAAISDAVLLGKPLYERILTVTGSGVKEPKNLKVRVGTGFEEVIGQCGGVSEDLAKLIMGGPMMGIGQFTAQVPVVKGTSGILLLNERDAKYEEPQNCIRCGKCVDACPVHLEPLFISALALQGRMEEAEKYHPIDCIECGSCSFICPSKRPLLDGIRLAKREALAKRRKS